MTYACVTCHVSRSIKIHYTHLIRVSELDLRSSEKSTIEVTCCVLQARTAALHSVHPVHSCTTILYYNLLHGLTIDNANMHTHMTFSIQHSVVKVHGAPATPSITAAGALASALLLLCIVAEARAEFRETKLRCHHGATYRSFATTAAANSVITNK